jgi:TolA-binding protein
MIETRFLTETGFLQRISILGTHSVRRHTPLGGIRNSPALSFATAGLVLLCLITGPAFAADEPAASVAPEKKTSKDKPRPSATKSHLPSMLTKELQVVLRRHPDVVAAESKVQLAESELDQVRMRIAQELIESRINSSILKQQFDRLRAIRQSGRPGASPEAFYETKAKLEALQAKMALLTSRRGPTSTRENSRAGNRAAEKIDKEVPLEEDNPMYERLRSLLKKEDSFNFAETPLQEMVDYLSDVNEIPLLIDRKGFEEVGMDVDEMTVDSVIGGLPMGALIEGFEDTHPVRFLVRNYGILVTAQGSEADRKYLSALEFWKEY